MKTRKFHVLDRYTHLSIYTGTRSDCLAFVQAFGLCYMVEL